MQKYAVSVPGKVILTGEHAVVYGSLAIAASINIRSTITMTINSSLDPLITIHLSDSEIIVVI